MSKIKGFGGWLEIFRGGQVTDSRGVNHDGDAMIKAAVDTFNAAEHEPPVVIGHPRTDDPAYGWVAGLKEGNAKDGGRVLLAKFSSIAPEFEALVKAGRYKKRSAAFYNDGRLRHLGFLGATPPAIKGLPNVAFNDGDNEPVTFEFSDYSLGVIGQLFGALREWIIEQQGVDAANAVIPSYSIETINTEAASSGNDAATPAANYADGGGSIISSTEEHGMAEKTFSEAEVKAAEDAAATTAREEGKRAAALEFAEQRNNQNMAEFKERCWPKSGDGKLPPALLDAGVMQFLESLDCHEQVEFAEASEKQSRAAWFMQFLESLPTSAVPFNEHAGRDKEADDSDAAAIAGRAREFQEREAAAGRTISTSEAVTAVMRK